ncbi:hypothetical protein GJ744_003710 [Endocarpon pusillum]|uniref:Uncharacterized protein n=1 Tax=Endocarpon pusillum TaxID=364733 RepID=A0A8H7AAC1_9EURO|nr:hypothetical protein GJ744_003710 [Endocarpon pusillum]
MDALKSTGVQVWGDIGSLGCESTNKLFRVKSAEERSTSILDEADLIIDEFLDCGSVIDVLTSFIRKGSGKIGQTITDREYAGRIVEQKKTSREPNCERAKQKIGRTPHPRRAIRFSQKNRRGILADCYSGVAINISQLAFDHSNDASQNIGIYEGMPTDGVSRNLPALMIHELADYGAPGWSHRRRVSWHEQID